MKTATRVAALIGGAALLAGCVPEPDMPMKKQAQYAQMEKLSADVRVTVTRIGVFADDTAYNSRRGVYVIKDSTTGKEYIGVSGIGISETGSHVCGKGCISSDER